MRKSFQILKFVGLIAGLSGAIYWFILRPVPVRTHVVDRGTVVSTIMGTGTLEARVKATISPKISGRLAEVNVDQGDQVVKGQLLATLDDEELRQQVEIAQAGIAAAHASLALVFADKGRAEAILDQAQRDHERARNLATAQVSTSEDLEKAAEALAVAEAGLARADAAIHESRKQILTAERTLAYHETRLSDTRMEAPFDGLIVRRHRDPGGVAVPGSAVLSIISTDIIWVSAWVDETEMSNLTSGQKADVVFRSEPDLRYEGEVLRLGRESDRETREFVVDVQVLSLPRVWAVGQRAEVFIETGRKDGCTVVPRSLIAWNEGVSGVFVQVDGRSRWRPLKLGSKSPSHAEVIEGLDPGDVVIAPLNPKAGTLSEGIRVSTP